MPSIGIAAIRMIVLLLCLTVWALLHVDARLAYHQPSRSRKHIVLRTAAEVGAAAVFFFQISLMELLAPQDAYGDHFLIFLMVECGGGILMLFLTLLRERWRSRRFRTQN